MNAARKPRRGRIPSGVPAAPARDKENEVRRNFVFGPVPSRRLGISLGVDVIPPKTCTLDCIYCEAGRTRRLTKRRRAYVPAAEVVRQVGAALRKGGRTRAFPHIAPAEERAAQILEQEVEKALR